MKVAKVSAGISCPLNDGSCNGKLAVSKSFLIVSGGIAATTDVQLALGGKVDLKLVFVQGSGSLHFGNMVENTATLSEMASRSWLENIYESFQQRLHEI